MTVSLSPRQVVSEVIGRRVEDHPTIKGWGVTESGGGKERWPIEHIAGGEIGRDCCHDFTTSVCVCECVHM